MPKSSDPSITVLSTTTLKDQERIQRELEELARKDPRGLIVRLAELGRTDEARQQLELLESHYRQIQAKLEHRIKELSEPPLRDGVYLKSSPDEPEHGAIVGIGGARMEVRLAVDPPAPPEKLPGREVWINSDNQVVKFRDDYVRGEVAEVIELVGESRLRVKGQGNSEIVIERLPSLARQVIEPGDTVRIHPALGVAFEKLAEKEKKALEPERIPDVRYEQIGGLDRQIEEIREAIEHPFFYRQVFRDYDLKRPKGILLHGPPGCGKTMVAKAIANSLSREIRQRLTWNAEALELCLGRSSLPLVEHYQQWRAQLRATDQAELPAGPNLEWADCRNAIGKYLAEQKVKIEAPEVELDRLRKAAAEEGRGYFLTISGPELLNKYVGETEYSIRRIFALARKKASPDTPVVIFFDELESMFSRRGSHLSSDIESTVVPQLLSEIDGMDELSDVIIIGASNRYDLIDPAVLRPGRLDLKILVERPDARAATNVLTKYLTSQVPLAAATVEEFGGVEQAVAGLIVRLVGVIYSDKSYLQIFEKADRQETMNREHRMPLQKRKMVREIMSGAMLEAIVTRAKRSAVRRQIETGQGGLQWQSDLLNALRTECEESKEQYISEIRVSRDVADNENFAVEVHLDEESAGSSGPAAHRWFKGKTRAWLAPKPNGAHP